MLRKVAIVAVFLVGLLSLYLTNSYLNREVSFFIDSDMEKQIELFAVQLEYALATRIHVAENLGVFFTAHPESTSDEFAKYAEGLFALNPPLRALQFADETTQVIYVYPPRGNEITISEPMVLIDDPLRGSYVRDAIEGRKLTVQPPFELRQGGLGMVARWPVFVDGYLIGLTIAVLDVPAILHDAVSVIDSDKYEYKILDRNSAVIYSNISTEAQVLSRTVTFADANWSIAIAPRAGVNWYPEDAMLLVNLASIGFLIAILTLLLFFQRRHRYLEEAVALKTADISQALEVQNLLMRETHHRIKNNLNLVAGLIAIKANQMQHGEQLEGLSQQITTIALINQQLQKSQHAHAVQLDRYFNDILNSVFYIPDIENYELQIEVPAILVRADKAVLLGLIINELATNSLKHAFSKTAHNIFSLKLAPADPEVPNAWAKGGLVPMKLIVTNNGPAMPENYEDKIADSLGLSLVQKLTHQLDAKIAIEKEPHPVFTISFQIEVMHE